MHKRLSLTIFALLCNGLILSANAQSTSIPVPMQKPESEDNSTPREPAKPASPSAAQKDAEPATEAEAEEPKASETDSTATDAKTTAPETGTDAPSNFPACELELKKEGGKFVPIKPISDGGGCGVKAPVELEALHGGIKLSSKATLSCPAALALVKWVKYSVVPNLEIAAPDKKLAAIDNSSSYVCRNRNHAKGGKISEHAKGNAFDIASFAFTDGTKLVMKPRVKDGTMEGAFQRSISASACLFFSTVLSPGSDATHQNHMHMDVMERKNAYRYCL